jgi:hypothetical protein
MFEALRDTLIKPSAAGDDLPGGDVANLFGRSQSRLCATGESGLRA